MLKKQKKYESEEKKNKQHAIRSRKGCVFFCWYIKRNITLNTLNECFLSTEEVSIATGVSSYTSVIEHFFKSKYKEGTKIIRI